MATLGDATDFGDLLTTQNNLRAASSKTRGIFTGGHDGTNNLNTIESVQIATTGNSVDFGDMAYISGNVGQVTMNSNAHGGI